MTRVPRPAHELFFVLQYIWHPNKIHQYYTAGVQNISTNGTRPAHELFFILQYTWHPTKIHQYYTAGVQNISTNGCHFFYQHGLIYLCIFIYGKDLYWVIIFFSNPSSKIISCVDLVTDNSLIRHFLYHKIRKP